MTPKFFWIFAFVFYGLSNLSFFLEIGLSKQNFRWLGNGLALVAVLSHVASLTFPTLHIHDALGLLAILTLISYFVVEWKWQLRGLGFLATANAFLFTLISITFPDRFPPINRPELSGSVLEVHIVLMILSFGILAFAFCVSVAYLIQDFILRKKQTLQVSRRLPPLNTLDLLINRLVGLGFLFMTIGIISGSVWAARWWGHWWGWDPKQILALLTWIFYAIYIYTRTLSGWKGKRSVILIVVGFALILITFVGTNFIPSRHQFQ